MSNNIASASTSTSTATISSSSSSSSSFSSLSSSSSPGSPLDYTRIPVDLLQNVIRPTLDLPIHSSQPIKGVIFDMDGTLTLPGLINFKRIRQRLDLHPSIDLIDALRSSEQARIVIEEEEKMGMDQCTLQPGFQQLMAFLEKHNIKKAIVTRNGHVAVTHFLQHFSLSADYFSPILDRDFIGGFKPSPAPIMYILQKWNLQPQDVIMVGDARDDLLSGTRAQARTCLISNVWVDAKTAPISTHTLTKNGDSNPNVLPDDVSPESVPMVDPTAKVPVSNQALEHTPHGLGVAHIQSTTASTFTSTIITSKVSSQDATHVTVTASSSSTSSSTNTPVFMDAVHMMPVHTQHELAKYASHTIHRLDDLIELISKANHITE